MKKLKINTKTLVEKAMGEIETLTADEVSRLCKNNEILLVDIRDPREVKREGKIEGAFHCPRGLIEFWIDPESPYYNEKFDTERKLVLYCAMGWRSALTTKTLQEMGVEPIAHLEGGFEGWKKADFPIEKIEEKK